MTQSTLGAKIRRLRKEKGMTQASLAGKLHVTDKAVSKWERELSFPDISLLPTLANELGVTIGELLGEDLDEKNASRLIRIFRMSHDLRTPLHIILGCASMAELYPNDLERLHRYLENIRVSGEYLLQTINQLMNMTQSNDDSSSSKGWSAEGTGQPLRGGRTETASEIVARYDFSGRRILIVEDMELNREIAGEWIRRTGAEVEFAEDGELCLKKIKDAPAGTYDLILMDIQMPNMDGIEATQQIRWLPDPRKSEIPIIAMTAKVYTEDRLEAFAAGMDAFAEKPLVIEDLLEAMREQLYL